MARIAGSSGEKTEAAIRVAAAVLIARHGYEAMSMRQLAAKVGVQPAALYRYFPTKEDLLFMLMREHMVALLKRPSGDPSGGQDPGSALADFVTHHVDFHLRRREATQVSNMELRSLSPERLQTILGLRSEYENRLRSILRDGVAAGAFAVEDVGLAAMAILQMITGVIVWFRPEDRLSADDIAAAYRAMAARIVGGSQREVHHV